MTRLTIYFNDSATAKVVESLCEILPGVLSVEHDEYENNNVASEPAVSYAKAISNPPKSKKKNKRRTGLDEALDDVASGRITRYESVDDFFKEMGL